MKKILFLLILLTGCTNLNFTEGEYTRLIDIKIAAEKAKLSCGTSKFNYVYGVLKSESYTQMVYADLRSTRGFMQEPSRLLYQSIINYEKIDDPSKVFCIEKMENISNIATDMAKQMGNM